MSEQYDVNMVTISGEIVSQPALIQLKNGAVMLIFTLRSLERFRRSNGEWATNRNQVRVEFLGKSAERHSGSISEGKRCAVSGYLRSDSTAPDVRVRGFHLQELS